MGHFIRCIIGSDKIIELLADKWIQAKKVPLKYGFSVIPMTECLFDDMNELVNEGSDSPHAELEFLSTSIEQILKEQSYFEKIGYIETEYFGGSGAQSAILYFKGEIFKGPLLTNTNWNEKQFCYVDDPEGEKAINIILYNMGMEKRSDMDAFDSIGLGNYRSNEKLLKAYNII